jgi:DNA-directed RNA polymerase specialized sigma subunit
VLNQENLLDYVRKAKQGDNSAKSILFEHNAPLIKSIIRRFKDKGVEYEDLYQIACIGFLKAVNNFNEQFEVKSIFRRIFPSERLLIWIFAYDKIELRRKVGIF